jgi:hypothetical protein
VNRLACRLAGRPSERRSAPASTMKTSTRREDSWVVACQLETWKAILEPSLEPHVLVLLMVVDEHAPARP